MVQKMPEKSGFRKKTGLKNFSGFLKKFFQCVIIMIVKCFSFFQIPIFKTKVAILLFGGKILELQDPVREFPTDKFLLHDILQFLPLDVTGGKLKSVKSRQKKFPIISLTNRNRDREHSRAKPGVLRVYLIRTRST